MLWPLVHQSRVVNIYWKPTCVAAKVSMFAGEMAGLKTYVEAYVDMLLGQVTSTHWRWADEHPPTLHSWWSCCVTTPHTNTWHRDKDGSLIYYSYLNTTSDIIVYNYHAMELWTFVSYVFDNNSNWQFKASKLYILK